VVCSAAPGRGAGASAGDGGGAGPLSAVPARRPAEHAGRALEHANCAQGSQQRYGCGVPGSGGPPESRSVSAAMMACARACTSAPARHVGSQRRATCIASPGWSLLPGSACYSPACGAYLSAASTAVNQAPNTAEAEGGDVPAKPSLPAPEHTALAHMRSSERSLRSQANTAARKAVARKKISWASCSETSPSRSKLPRFLLQRATCKVSTTVRERHTIQRRLSMMRMQLLYRDASYPQAASASVVAGREVLHAMSKCQSATRVRVSTVARSRSVTASRLAPCPAPARRSTSRTYSVSSGRTVKRANNTLLTPLPNRASESDMPPVTVPRSGTQVAD